MSETAYAIQRNSDRMYLERWVYPSNRWCEDGSEAMSWPSMTHATTEALDKMPAGADWIVVPIQEKENS